MKMDLTKDGILHINLFDIEVQEEEDQFIYYYLGLSRNVKKQFENAYFQAYHNNLLTESDVKIIHTITDNITYIEVHPNDILKNLKIIKSIMLTTLVIDDDNE